MLAGHPLIDQLLAFDAEGILVAGQQEYDLVLSLDKEAGPAALCNAVRCADKRGMGLSRWGTVQPINRECEDYFRLGLDDELKFHGNEKSYPELIHQAVGLPYLREPYRLYCDETSAHRARVILAPVREELRGPIIGLNTGSGNVFANKAPRPSHWVEICKTLVARGYSVVLLGGAEEDERNAWIRQRAGAGVHLIGQDHGEQLFVAVVSQCDAIVSGDSLAMHVAVARGVPVVALFGPTCQQEIDLFDNGIKLQTSLACGPCYRRHCDIEPHCMDVIETGRIVAAVDELLRKPR